MNLSITRTAGLLLGCLSAGAVFAQSPCHATLDETQKKVAWQGGVGEIRWSGAGDCKAEASGLPWVAVSALPPGSTGERILKYSIDTNLAPHARRGTIHLGEAALAIEQAGGPTPGMSFVPARLEFSVTPGKPGGTTQSLYAASDDILVVSAHGDPLTWLDVKPAPDNSTPQRAVFQVTVDPKRLQPGSYTANIYLEAQGVTNPKETVPVTLLVGKP